MSSQTSQVMLFDNMHRCRQFLMSLNFLQKTDFWGILSKENFPRGGWGVSEGVRRFKNTSKLEHPEGWGYRYFGETTHLIYGAVQTSYPEWPK